MNRHLLGACATVLALAACSSPSTLESLEPVTTSPAVEPSADPETPEAPEPTPGSEPTSEPGSAFEALGIDWPEVTRDEVDWPAPPVPEGFTEAEVQRIAGPLREWAARAALDPGVWAGESGAKDVLEPLGATAHHAASVASRSVSPGLAVGNVFGRDVEVKGKPRMTTSWRTTTEKTAVGPVLRLWLQTRTAYEVEEGGRTNVIGVVREHALGALPGATPHGALSVTGWFEYGAQKCSLAIDDALVPEEATDPEALEAFIAAGSRETYAEPEIADDQRIDAAFLDRCTTGAK